MSHYLEVEPVHIVGIMELPITPPHSTTTTYDGTDGNGCENTDCNGKANTLPQVDGKGDELSSRSGQIRITLLSQ